VGELELLDPDSGGAVVSKKPLLPSSTNGDFSSRLCRTLVDDLLLEMEYELLGVKSIRILADHPWIPGKRLRPITFLLAVLSQQIHQTSEPKLGRREVRLAAAIELLHEASLVHDDLVDRGTVRRGMPTIQMKNGAALALIVGDYMVFRALKLALDSAENGRDIGLAQQLANTGLEIAHGEVDQLDCYLNRRHDPERMSMSHYLGVIGKKTASFFGGCSEGGAALGGADEGTRAIYRDFGMNLGMVFQMVDDLMDILGDQSKAMKSLRNNIAEGTITLPMIHARDVDPIDPILVKIAVMDELDDREQHELYERLAEPEILARCQATMDEYTGRALEALGRIQPSIYREGLGDLMDYIQQCPWGGLEGKLK